MTNKLKFLSCFQSDMQDFGYGTLTHPYNKSSRLGAALVSIMLRNYTIAETAISKCPIGAMV